MQSYHRSGSRLLNNPVWRAVLALRWLLAAFGVVIAVACAITGGPIESIVATTFSSFLVIGIWSVAFRKRPSETPLFRSRYRLVKSKITDLIALAVPVTVYLGCIAVARHSTSQHWLMGLVIIPAVMLVIFLTTILVSRFSRTRTFRALSDRNWKREDRNRGDGGIGGVLAFLRPKPPVRSGPNQRTFAEALDRRDY